MADLQTSAAQTIPVLTGLAQCAENNEGMEGPESEKLALSQTGRTGWWFGDKDCAKQHSG